MNEERFEITIETENHEKNLQGRETCQSPLKRHSKASKQHLISAGDIQSSPSQVTSKQNDGQTLPAERKAASSSIMKHQEEQGPEAADHDPHLKQPKGHPVQKPHGHEENTNVPHLEVQKLVHCVVKELWEMYDLGEGPKVLSGLPKPCPSELFLRSITYGHHLKMSTRGSYCKVRK